MPAFREDAQASERFSESGKDIGAIPKRRHFMSKEYQELKKSYDSIKKKIPYEPKWGIVLGSGLGDFVENLKIDGAINFKDIKGFPKATNTAHKGRYVFTKINNVPVVVMQGRIHHYEGYSTTESVKTIRLMKLMGIENLIVTNAAGGTNKKFKANDLMLITDHISLFVRNPLIGENVDELGVRFPDMTEAYDKNLRDKITKAATKNKIKLQKGIYVQLTGPSYESPAEISLLAKLGASAVGMSTVIEVIAARHAGIKVAGISCITNMAAGLQKTLQNEEEVLENAKKSSDKIYKILKEIIK